MQCFGEISALMQEAIHLRFARRPATLLLAIDQNAMRDERTPDKIIELLPPEAQEKYHGRVWLVLVECIANALLHGGAEVLTLHFVWRHNELTMAVWQIPPLPAALRERLQASQQGWLPDYNDPNYEGGELGYPLLVRLCREVSLSVDLQEIRLVLLPADPDDASV